MIKFILTIPFFFIIACPLFAQDQVYGNMFTSGNVKNKKSIYALPISISQNFIAFKAKVNGVEGIFLWDNGFSSTSFDKEFAKKAGIKINPEKDIFLTDGNNNQVAGQSFKLKEFSIGPITFNDFYCSIVDLTNINSVMCKVKFAGVLGGSMINRLNWNFNFDKERVLISAQAFDKLNSKKIPFTISETQLHAIEVTINDHKINHAMIDFGLNDIDLCVYLGNSLLFEKQKEVLKIGALNLSLMDNSKIDSSYIISNDYKLKIGEHIIEKVPYINLTQSIPASVVLGNQFFRNTSNVIINTQHRNYLLYPRKTPFKAKVYSTNGILIRLIDGKWKIMGLIPNHPDIKANNIKLMDEVVSINKKLLQTFIGECEMNQYLSELRLEEKPLEVTFKNGKTVMLSDIKF